jgi:exosortase A-associated hydrolase 2
VTYYPAARPNVRNRLVLLAHPFGAELNRSRRLTASICRRLALNDVSAATCDLFGCGDSEGEHLEARWEIWRDDLDAAAKWLGCGSIPVVICGLGLGGLLATELAATNSTIVQRLVLVKPTVDGKAFVRRLLILCSLDPDSQTTPGDFRQTMQLGGVVEIAGYQVSHELLAAIAGTNLASVGRRVAQPISWIETGVPRSGEVSRDTRAVWQTWDAQGVAYRRTLVPVPARWGDLTAEEFRELSAAIEDALLAA